MGMDNATGLDGRSVLVTGGGSGIGRAMASAFAAEGARVMVADISAAGAAETVSKVTADGGTAHAFTVDVADERSIDALVTHTVEQHGAIDVLCNNAGVLDSMRLTEEVPNEEWQRVLSVNLTGPFMLTRAVLPHMVDRGHGAIVNTASAAGLRGGCGGVAYTVSKHGVVGLTRSTAYMYRDSGIRCNAICPGAVDTNIVSGGLDEKGFQRLSPVLMASGAMGQPEQVAAVAVFLASDAASFANGVVMPVDGGWFAG